MNALRPLHDPRLPQLAVAFDPSRMADVFEAELPGRRVLSCRIDRIKYRPRRNCSVAYRLDVVARDGSVIEQRVAARFCEPQESIRRFRKAGQRDLVASVAGPRLTCREALGMVAHWAPNDPKLPALALLADPRRLAGALQRISAQWPSPALSRALPLPQLVQYVPESRCCARLDFGSQVVFVKADAERRGAQTHAAMLALQASDAVLRGELITPRSLAWQPEEALHWQAGLPGVALLDRMTSIDSIWSERLGTGLAALHRCALPLSREIDPQAWAARPRIVGEELACFEPAWRDSLSALITGLERSGASADLGVQVTLHGDLHPRNLLVDGQRLAFIDLDSLRRGAAALELGAWLADVLYRLVLAAQTTAVDTAAAWGAARSFLAAYRAGGGQLPSMPVLARSTAHQLLCQRAYRCLANLKPGRVDCLPDLIRIALTIIRSGDVEAGFAAWGDR